RQDSLTGEWYDCSAHLLWAGERTRQTSGAHIEFLSGLKNPVACKLGPRATPAEALELCERLDPDGEAGRLTFITRMGAKAVREALPPLVQAIRDSGRPVPRRSGANRSQRAMAIGDPLSDPTLASDADREIICARLQEGHVHGRLTLEELSQRLDTALKARTRGELLPLIQDLPAPPGTVVGGPPKRWHIAVVGSTRRHGRWLVPAESWWTGVMGKCHLDLTRAQFEAQVTTINIARAMGSVEVRVPKGYEIQLEGTSLLGSK